MRKSLIASGIVGLIDLISLWLLHNDAISGHDKILPVYLFAGCGVLSAATWGYTASLITGGR